VEDIYGARLDRVNLAVGQGFDLAFTGNAVHRFQVVLVADMRFGTGKNGGDMEGKTHAIIFERQTHRLPVTVLGNHAAIGLAAFFQCSDNHVFRSLLEKKNPAWEVKGRDKG